MNKQTSKISYNMRQIKIKERAVMIEFSAPALILYLTLMVLPIGVSIYYSLFKWSGLGPMHYVGLHNYNTLYSDPDFKMVLKNTLILVFYSLIITTPIAAITAYMIYRTKVFFKFFRATIFLPVIISPIIIGLIFRIIFNGDFGPVNQFLNVVGLGNLSKPWLSDSKTVLGSVIVPQIWFAIGYYTILFLAAMQSVPEEIIESATIDGANSFTLFRKIMLPLISSVLQIIIILIVTGALKSFGFSWSMTEGGPGVRSSFLSVYMYVKAFSVNDIGVSSAVSFNIFMLGIGFTLIFKRIMSHI